MNAFSENENSFYVAAPFSKKEEVKAVMARLRENGGIITHDWTTHDPIKPYREHPQKAAEYALADLEGASNCHTFIMLPDEEGGTTLFAELGAAIVSPRVQEIFIVGPHNQRAIAFFHPKVKRLETIEEVIGY